MSSSRMHGRSPHVRSPSERELPRPEETVRQAHRRRVDPANVTEGAISSDRLVRLIAVRWNEPVDHRAGGSS